MNGLRKRPLSVGPIRAFEAVSRHLNFRAAAEELHLTQSAISRQVQSLEEDLGTALFTRGTRKVELTSAGVTLLRATSVWLDRLDATVRQIRQAQGRRIVSVSTFASFASLWLIPRMEEFQRANPQVDIRVSASDNLIDPEGNDGTEIDIALRYCGAAKAGRGAVRLFGECLSPMVSPWLLERSRSSGPPLEKPADLVHHTLMEEDSGSPTVEYIAWARWLREQNLPNLQPSRWIYFNYTYQQVQAALAGQGVTLARLPLTAQQLAAGELVEPFADQPETRISSPYSYWMVTRDRSELSEDVKSFCDWILDQAAKTRADMGEAD
jgi:LysR family glycine cleavage system transcriptional activator